MIKEPNFYNILKLFCFALLLVGTFSIASPSISCAQSSAGCATDTWTAMTNQAALEMRREDLVNKRFIVKADSVLQYSCFADEIANMADNVAPIFSGNRLWGTKPVTLIGGVSVVTAYARPGLSTSTLEESLSLVVDASLAPYIETNFNHRVLSGTTPLNEGPASLCYDMANVWQAAKCKNFDDTQVFYRFDDLIEFDPRQFPEEMACEL